MRRRALVSSKLPELRSGNTELDRWAAKHLQEFVSNVADRIRHLTPEKGQFAPTWDGFSSDPVGNISYLDFGDSVELWVDTARTGDSDEAFMLFSGLPLALTPVADRYVSCWLVDENNLRKGVASVLASSGVSFSLEQVASAPTDTIGFADVFTDPSTLGQKKGLPAGWTIKYPK